MLSRGAILTAIFLAPFCCGQGYIGVALADNGSGGALVGQVAPGGPADRAGLKPGDVILAVNNRPVENAAAITRAITSMPGGTTANLTVIRHGARQSIAVIVENKGARGAPTAPSGEAVFDAKAPVPAGVTFTRLTDPLEHAFSIDVPAGWKSEVGLARLGALNINPYIRSLSPDKMTYILMGEPTMPTFAPPTALTQKLGYREGTLYSPGFGQRVIILHYLPGAEFARTFGQMTLGNVCAGLQPVSTANRPDFAQQAEAAAHPLIPTRYDAGEATFSCTHHQQQMQASVAAVTWMTRDNVMWVVQNFGGFIAPKPQAAQAQAIVMHMTLSLQWDPAWVQKQNQLSQQAAAAIARRIQDFERQQAAFTAKLNALDENFESMDEIISGYTRYHDAQTGQDYTLSNTNPYKWIDDTGRIVSTPTNVKPPWGYTFRPLPPAPH
jgi:hypothetical protein